MTRLFEETAIKSMRMKNRIVRSATWEGMCEDDGRPTPKLIDFYVDLAEGGVGLIISSYAFVSPEGKQLPGKLGIQTDDFADEFRQMTDAVHGAGGTIAIQMVHAGGQANPKTSGMPALAPSGGKVAQFPAEAAELSVDDISRIVTAFAEGARRAKEWGFDGVQLHGAHGYLINQFLSPLTNRRTDTYGGSIENRCRFLMEVYQAVREQVGDDYPVMIKLNLADNLEGGLEVSDGLVAAEKLGVAGIDAIEVSSGTPASGEMGPSRPKINKPEREAYNMALAKQVQKVVKCPVMVVGGFRSYEVSESAVGEGGVDYIAMSRPFIREPGLAGRWSGGDRSPSTCVSCGKCFIPGLKEGGIYCVTEKKLQERAATQA